MPTTRLTKQTTGDLKRLEGILGEIAQLEQQAEALKWAILDRREIGSQQEIGKLYGVSRSAVGQWIKARDKERQERPVARRSLESGQLLCVRCAPDDSDALEPLASDDLPEGGVCGECGTDVLISGKE